MRHDVQQRGQKIVFFGDWFHGVLLPFGDGCHHDKPAGDPNPAKLANMRRMAASSWLLSKKA